MRQRARGGGLRDPAGYYSSYKNMSSMPGLSPHCTGVGVDLNSETPGELSNESTATNEITPKQNANLIN